MTGGSSTDRTLPANDRIVSPVLHECLGLCPRTLFPQLPDPNHKGVFTAHELNWTDLQLVDPVTRGGVHWSRASASRLDWAAAKLGRLVLSRFMRCECVCSELQFGNCGSFQFVCGVNETNQYSTTFAKRAFRCSAPAVWNSLPKTVISIGSVAVLKSRLETFLFFRAFSSSSAH